MTTPDLAIRRNLVRLGRRHTAASVTLGICRGAAPLLLVILAALAADNLLALPEALRAVLLVAVAALLTRLVLAVMRPLSAKPSPERTARLLEESAGIPDNRLINGCQFAGEDPQRRRTKAEAVFQSVAIAAAERALAEAPRAQFYRVPDLRRWGAGAVALLALGIAYGVVFPDRAANAARRLLLPLADVPPLGAVRITVEPATDVTVDEGSPLTIRVRLTPADGRGSIEGIVPELVRAPGDQPLPTDRDAGERQAIPRTGDAYALTLPALTHPFTFRIHAAGSWTGAVRVHVLPPPAITRSSFVVIRPAYVGGSELLPGPPATLTVLPGSRADLALTLDREVASLVWRVGDQRIALGRKGPNWVGVATITAAAPYSLESGDRVLARGAVQIAADAPPSCALVTPERNLLLSPGATLDLGVNAGDDHGLAALTVTVREGQTLKAWKYLGPPGPSSVSERLRIEFDALRFPPGRTYVIEAVATDGKPQTTAAAPVVVRLRSLADLTLPEGDPRAQAFAALKEALAAENQARGVTATITANRDDIVKHGGMEVQVQAQGKAQRTAGDKIDHAGKRFAEAKDERTRLALLGIATDARAVEGEIPAGDLPRIATHQDDIVARLTALIGALADSARPAEKSKKGETSTDGVRRKLEQLKEDLQAFTEAQEKIIERSKTLAEKGPADLTDGDRKILGDLAKEENEWSKFLESKVGDLAKLPPQDFTDSSMGTETNAVFQEVKLAADALTRKSIELAVPREQSGLELAKNMVQNLEKWLMNTPDKIKWSMEDAQAPADVPVAELPAELEDIVGDLLDKEEAMTDDVEDVTSAWMDSIDKGAGWDAGDGPISNMSAKGITGNQLPNQSEISGRSGEGRTGRSNGQFVQDEAVGKQGRDTPTRLTETPFERGSVKDSSKEQPSGATGGGKVAGSAAEGLVGNTPPPPVKEALARLAGNQAALRQKAGAIALQLRSRKLPSGDLETAVAAMADVEAAAKAGKINGLRQRYAEALDALGDAKRSVAGASQVQQERSQLPERLRGALQQGTPETVPAGYEDLVGSYFQALSGAQQ